VRASHKILQRPRRIGVGLCFEEATVDHGVDREIAAGPQGRATGCQMAGERSEAVTLTPPDCLGKSSIPGDRTHPGRSVGRLGAEWSRRRQFHRQSGPRPPAIAVARGRCSFSVVRRAERPE
jgi:hypothetical protein